MAKHLTGDTEVDLAVLNQKLDTLTESVNKLSANVEKITSYETRLALLEQSHKTQVWTVRMIVTALGGLLLKIFFEHK